MFFKKIIGAVLIFSLVLGLFSGCRTKGPTEKREDYTGIELTYYKVFDEKETMEPIINDYLATHPGLKINYRMFSDFDEYQDVILNEMAQGEGPDIFSMPNTWFASNLKKISPMPDEFGTRSDFEETFVDAAADDLIWVDKEGKEHVYALPMTVDTLALYYNKDQFEDKLPQKGKPSATWEGIKDDVVVLNKVNSSDVSQFDISGIALGRSDNITRAVDILYLLFLQYGVEFYNEEMSQATFGGNKAVDDRLNPALDALQFYTSFADSDNRHYSWNEFSAEDDSEGQEIAAFAAGKASMIVGFSYTYDYILDQIAALDKQGVKVIDKGNIRIAPIPQLYDPEVANDKRVTYSNYFAETVSRNAENPEVAWDFLIYLTSKKVQDYYFQKTHRPTSRRDLIEKQKKDPLFGVFAAQTGYAESFPIVMYYRYKEIFADIISKANNESVVRSDLIHAQDLIDEMLPPDGLKNKKLDEEETDSEKSK